ncbi:MAG TPA: hypothetical protein VHS30_08070 [Streptosporangiaceae bacterium]|jgi:hypothetical protein|nr:hypothetical protein [Streptosporangiaceae bacterium]
MRSEIAREPARSEKIGEDLAVVVTEGPAGGTVEPGHLGQHAHVAAPSRGRPAARPGKPRWPAHCRPHPAQRTDMLIWDGWVATPSSANSLVSRG